MNIFKKIAEVSKSIVNNIMSFNSPEKQLDKTIDKFNEKIEKVVIEKPEIADIQPSMIFNKDKYKDASKEEIKQEIKSLKGYLKKGAENPVTSKTGNTVPKWEEKDVREKVKIINAEREKEREFAENQEVKSRGEKVGLKRGEMGKERLAELQPKPYDFDKIKSGKEWEKFKETVNKQVSPKYNQEKYAEYKMNYIKALEKNFGDYARDTIDKLKQLPSHYLVEIYYGEQEATIDFAYSIEEMRTRLDIINSIWNNAIDENPNILNEKHWGDKQENELQEWISKGQ